MPTTIRPLATTQCYTTSGSSIPLIPKDLRPKLMILKSLARIPDLPPLIRIAHARIYCHTDSAFPRRIRIHICRSPRNPAIRGSCEDIHNCPDPQQVLNVITQFWKRFIESPRNSTRDLLHGAQDPTRGRKLDDVAVDVTTAGAIGQWVSDAGADGGNAGVEVEDDRCAGIVDGAHAFENPPKHVVCENFVWPDGAAEQVGQPPEGFLDVVCWMLAYEAEGLAAEVVVNAGEPDLLDDGIWRFHAGEGEAGLEGPQSVV